MPADRREARRAVNVRRVLGALSWIVEQGRAGDVDLADMRAVLAIRYHDDRPHRIEHADRTFAVTVRVVSRALPTM